jgi:hypothetical protein
MQNMRDMRERERTWHQCRKKHETTNVELFTTGKKHVRFPLLAATPANTYGFKCSLRKPRMQSHGANCHSILASRQVCARILTTGWSFFQLDACCGKHGLT